MHRQLRSGATLLGGMLLAAAPALADEAIKYEPNAGGDVVKNLAGVAYLGLVLFFVVRLLSKRANTATQEARSGFWPLCERHCCPAGRSHDGFSTPV